MAKIQLIRSFNCMVIQGRGCSYGGCAYTKSQKILYPPGEAGWKEFTKPLSSLFLDLQKMRRRRIQTILTYVMATDRLVDDDDDLVIAVWRKWTVISK